MSAPETRATSTMAADLADLRLQLQTQAANFADLQTLFTTQKETLDNAPTAAEFAALQQQVATARTAALEAQALAYTATNPPALAPVAAGTPTAPTAAEFAELQAQVATNAATAARGPADFMATYAETQAATTAAALSPMITSPLRGGLLHIPGKLSVVWTGGGLSATASERLKAASPFAYRPAGLKEMSSIYEHNTTGLSTEKRLEVASTAGTVTLMAWKNNCHNHFVKNGQDGVMLVKMDGVEMPLVANSGRINSAKAKLHVTELLDSGDEYDEHNLATSGEFLLDSIGPALLSSIQTLMPANDPASAMGPFIFMLIMERIMTSSSSLWRDMVTKLGGMRIANEPGENVGTFSEKLKSMCMALEGAGELPNDVSFLICRSIMKCSVKVFESHYTALYANLQFNPRAITWHAIIVEAVGLYNALVQDNEWTVNDPVPPRSLAALVPSSTGPSGEDRTCHLCGVAGHLSRNCPTAQGKRNSRQRQPMPLWKTTGPAPGQPETMTKYDKTYFWCTTCSHWNVTHLTENHTSGIGKRAVTAPPTPAPPVAAVAAAPPVAAVVAPPVSLIPAPFNLSTFGFKCSLVSDQDVDVDYNYLAIEAGADDISLKD